MKRSTTLPLFAVAFVALGALATGCEEKKPETTSTPSATPSAVVSAAPSASASAAPSAVAAVEDDTPTEEDFEDEADNTITEKNLDEELAKLENEIK